MANRRMFSLDVVDTDKFLEMPASSQNLYFHLGMRADDDGFVASPLKITKIANCGQDDLNVLISRGFIIPFESGVIVITHWNQNNSIKPDRYKKTVYQNEKNLLVEKNGIYSLEPEWNQVGTKMEPNWNQIGTKVEPQDRLGKDSIDKVSIDQDSIDKVSKEKSSKEKKYSSSNDDECCTDVLQITATWNSLESVGIKKIIKLVPGTKRYQMLTARIKQYGFDAVMDAIENIRKSDFLQGKNNRGWTITFDWFVSPNNFPKVLEGNYNSNRKPQSQTEQMLNSSYEMFAEWAEESERRENDAKGI